MEISTVKIQQNGYLINGTTFIPETYSGWMRELLDEWLKTNTPEPEFTEEELAQKALLKEKAQAKELLDSTDWITNKYNDEVTVLGKLTKAQFLSKYKAIYEDRAKAREILSK